MINSNSNSNSNIRLDSLGQIITKGANVLFYDVGTSSLIKGTVIGSSIDGVKCIDIKYFGKVSSWETDLKETKEMFSQVHPQSIVVLDIIKSQMPELFI